MQLEQCKCDSFDQQMYVCSEIGQECSCDGFAIVSSNPPFLASTTKFTPWFQYDSSFKCSINEEGDELIPTPKDLGFTDPAQGFDKQCVCMPYTTYYGSECNEIQSVVTSSTYVFDSSDPILRIRECREFCQQAGTDYFLATVTSSDVLTCECGERGSVAVEDTEQLRPVCGDVSAAIFPPTLTPQTDVLADSSRCIGGGYDFASSTLRNEDVTIPNVVTSDTLSILFTYLRTDWGSEWEYAIKCDELHIITRSGFRFLAVRSQGGMVSIVDAAEDADGISNTNVCQYGRAFNAATSTDCSELPDDFFGFKTNQYSRIAYTAESNTTHTVHTLKENNAILATQTLEKSDTNTLTNCKLGSLDNAYDLYTNGRYTGFSVMEKLLIYDGVVSGSEDWFDGALNLLLNKSNTLHVSGLTTDANADNFCSGLFASTTSSGE